LTKHLVTHDRSEMSDRALNKAIEDDDLDGNVDEEDLDCEEEVKLEGDGGKSEGEGSQEEAVLQSLGLEEEDGGKSE
jgi:bacillopeptidase F (M6 metalloprotease family)